MTLPLIELDGTPFDQGRQHGLALREQIAHNIALYYDRFLREAHLDASEVRRRASTFVPLLERIPAYFDGMRGIVETSQVELVDVVMLNMRYELLYYQYSITPVGGPDGCTSFALLPSATTNGHLLLGENWDWIPDVRGAVLHTHDDGMETLSFTEAGIVGGKIGFNSFGLGLAINGLLSTSDDWSRMEKPFHVRCHEILRASDFASALPIVSEGRRACSTNFLIGQAPDRIVDIEAAPDTTCAYYTEDSALAHTNHFLEPTHLGVDEPEAERRPHSYTRLQRMRQLLAARKPLSVADVHACLRDHDNYPDSICRHYDPADPPEEACVTVISAVMDLNARTLWVSDGPPCEHLFEEYRL